MLLEYRFNNFCSFYGSCEFGMEAPGGKVQKRFPENFVEAAVGYDVLKTAVIVGENAGGKSNFINSLKFLKSLFANNENVKSVRAFVNMASFKAEKEPIQEFAITVVGDNKAIYTYELGISENGIQWERLLAARKKRVVKKMLLEVKREEQELDIFTHDEDITKALKKSAVNMGLFISKMALLGDDDANAFVSWMNTQLYPEAVNDGANQEIVKMEEDMRILKDERYLDIFRMVDYSICGIEVDSEKPYSKTLIYRKNKSGDIYTRELQKDSTGVKEFFAWAVQIFRVVYENKVVFADEMDRVLNPILSDRVIAFINGKTHKGQFIFSTHNVLHLDLKTYMKEQIYFITKDCETLTSELYSLADFPEVRYETTKIYEFYLKGILGGTAYE